MGMAQERREQTTGETKTKKENKGNHVDHEELELMAKRGCLREEHIPLTRLWRCCSGVTATVLGPTLGRNAGAVARGATVSSAARDVMEAILE